MKLSNPPLIPPSQNNLLAHHMDIADFETIENWCLSEGWNMGLYDSEAYSQNDREGHLIFLVNKESIGSISLVKHKDNFFTIGPFIVREDMRHKGYGTMIWQIALERIRDNHSISILLYAVKAQIERYKKLGFESQFVNQRWELKDPKRTHFQSRYTPTIITPEYIDKLVEYDTEIFSASRGAILTNILKKPNVTGCLVQDDTTIKGVGIIRPCHNGFRIGPLSANSSEVAECIIQQLINSVNYGPIIIDKPHYSESDALLMSSFGFIRRPDCDTTAMVKGVLPQAFKQNLKRHYAIFSLEQG